MTSHHIILILSQISIYDDKTFYCRHSNLQKIASKLQDNLDKFQQWSMFNKLSLNIDKTKKLFYIQEILTLSISI